MSLNLKNLLRQDTSSLVACAEFKHGIRLHVRFFSRSDLQRLARVNTIMAYDRNEKTRTPQVDAKKFAAAFVKAVLVNWDGLTPRSLSKIIPTDLATLTPEQMDEPIPFDMESAVALVQTAYELDSFLQEVCSDPMLFNPTLEAEMGNSPSSPSGS